MSTKGVLNNLALNASKTASVKLHTNILLEEGLQPSHGAETALGSVPSPLQMTQVVSFFCASLPPLDSSVQAVNSFQKESSLAVSVLLLVQWSSAEAVL